VETREEIAVEVNVAFASIFGRLRDILRKHAGALTVTANAPDHYCLTVTDSPKLKKGFPAAWVKIGKRYVSYHFMPIYMFPGLRDGLSKKLRARMQGKSCFNFKCVDETLFQELETLTAQGFAMARKAGLGPTEKTAS
jgi:hypothetical protein